jgi:gas vesicle protein
MEKGIAKVIGIGLIAGAAIGAGLGLLYAPQSGKKTRKEIMERADDFTDAVKKRAEDFSDMLSDRSDKYRKMLIDAIK